MTVPTIKDALAAKLRAVLATDRVYPNYEGLGDDPGRAKLPAVVYRQTGGERYAAGDVGATDYRTDTFLVEVFDQDAATCERVRGRIEAALAGPPNGEDDPGRPAVWVRGGPVVHWAAAADPASDAEFPFVAAHELLCYEQVVVTVEHSGGG